MPSFAQSLLSDCLVAQGLDRTQADKAAACALEVLPAAGIVRQADVAAFELDAHIYYLRGKTLNGRPITVTVISERVGRGRAAVFNAIRRHARARRAVLKLIA